LGVLLWIYKHYMEYLVIWQGQIPREIRWYDTRFAHPYLVVVWAVLFFSFLLPFPILLIKKLKENPVTLLTLAYCTLAARVLEMHGMVTPTQPQSPWPTLGFAVIFFVAWLRWLIQQVGAHD